MNIKLPSFYLQLVVIALTGVWNSYADDTASGLDPTMVPTVSPSPSTGGVPTMSPQPSYIASDVPSDMMSDIPSDLASDVASDLSSELPSMGDTTERRAEEETSGVAASTATLFGMFLLSIGLF